MFKKNPQSNKNLNKNDKLPNESNSVPKSSQNATVPLQTTANKRQYSEEFLKNYNFLKIEELKLQTVPKKDETVVLHRYEICRGNENESESDDSDINNNNNAYENNTSYLAMNKFDRLVYRLSGNSFIMDLLYLGVT